jgi:hypothetical protein
LQIEDTIPTQPSASNLGLKQQTISHINFLSLSHLSGEAPQIVDLYTSQKETTQHHVSSSRLFDSPGSSSSLWNSGLVRFEVVPEEEATQSSGGGSQATAVVLGTDAAGRTNAAEGTNATWSADATADST